jgi:uncharacterized protein (DUF2132 family)
MHAAGPKNPLHGITLEKMLTELEAHYGWEMLGRMIKINCFNFHPSIKSSLVFLRRTPWARQKVEELYIDSLPDLKAKTDEPMAEAFDEMPAREVPAQEATAEEETKFNRQ